MLLWDSEKPNFPTVGRVIAELFFFQPVSKEPEFPLCPPHSVTSPTRTIQEFSLDE